MSKYIGTLPTLPERGYFKNGDKGAEAKKLQQFLNWALQGAFSTLYVDELKVDGEIGPKTVKAVKLFQNVHHLKVDGEFGSVSLKKAKAVKMSKPLKAINWAVAISLDNNFAYGVGDRAHHNGCYFCGTNITGPKKAKKGDKWEKTYCCNPFVHAAYAHGAGIPSMLTACKKASAAGMTVGSWTKHGFKKIGAVKDVAFSELKAGDVIICESHVWMYTGSDGIVEASGESWGAGSIAHKTGAKSRINTYKKKKGAYVLRYVEKTTTTTTTAKKTTQQKMVEWAEKIEKEGTYKYKKWDSKDKATHLCPICNKQTGKYHGWNCIGYVTAICYHGGGIPIKCSCSGLGDDAFYTNVTEASWRKRNGEKWDMIDNGGKKGGTSIPQSKLKAGDVLICYDENGKFQHLVFYKGNGKYSDCTSGRAKGVGEGTYSNLAKRKHVTRAFRYKG